MQSPLSHSRACRLIKTIDAAIISSRWRKEFAIDWSPEPGINEIRYWRDDASGLCFYTPLSVAGDESLYVQLQRFPWYYMDDKWEFRRALKLLEKYKQASAARVLEVGVGKGAFLRQAQRSGIEISGVELNSDGAEAARRLGFTIFDQDLESLGVNQASTWDAICAFQVLEHLPDPKGFLEQALHLLRPGGILILSVPNADVARRLDPDRRNLLDQPPHHMTHWNEKVFSFLERDFPVRVADLAFEPLAPYHIDWFMGSWRETVRLTAGSTIQKLLFNRLSMLLLRLFLVAGTRRLIRGHTLLVCLQKT